MRCLSVTRVLSGKPAAGNMFPYVVFVKGETTPDRVVYAKDRTGALRKVLEVYPDAKVRARRH